MNPKQWKFVALGAALLTLLFLFPAWSTTNGAAKFDLGHSWITAPPESVGPDDFGELSLGPEWTEQDRQRMREHLAAGFGPPEINWFRQGLYGSLIVIVFGSYAFAFRERRPSAKSPVDPGTFE